MESLPCTVDNAVKYVLVLCLLQTSAREIFVHNMQLHNYTNFHFIHHLAVNSTDVARGDLRLIGNSSTMGKLQMQLDGVWTQVCSAGFSTVAANVACSQLGLGSNGTVHTDGRLVS